jgi:hypothetical protein
MPHPSTAGGVVIGMETDDAAPPAVPAKRRAFFSSLLLGDMAQVEELARQDA